MARSSSPAIARRRLRGGALQRRRVARCHVWHGRSGLHRSLSAARSTSRARWRCRPDGKIVVAGNSSAPGNPANQDFALVRYNSDGSLDTTFGTGGMVRTDFGAGNLEGAFSVAIDSAGRIVAAGGTFNAATAARFRGRALQPGRLARHDVRWRRPRDRRSVLTNFDGDRRRGDSGRRSHRGRGLLTRMIEFRAVRYNTDGSLDTTFGGTGIVIDELRRHRTTTRPRWSSSRTARCSRWEPRLPSRATGTSRWCATTRTDRPMRHSASAVR